MAVPWFKIQSLLPFEKTGLDFFMQDTSAQDTNAKTLPPTGRYTSGTAKINTATQPLDAPAGLQFVSAAGLEADLLTKVVARPWDRDPHDVRILVDHAEGRGKIIESEIGGHHVQKPTYRVFVPDDWGLATMEPRRPDVLDSGTKSRGT
jgi:hypothetical protein